MEQKGSFMKRWFLNNIGLKILSLLLAIFIWFYVSELIKHGVSAMPPISILKTPEITSKYLLIEPKIKGEPAKGYRIAKEKITITPYKSLVVGPASLLQDVNKVYTAPVDVEGAKRVVKKKVAIESIEETKIDEVEFVDIIIPIERIK